MGSVERWVTPALSVGGQLSLRSEAGEGTGLGGKVLSQDLFPGREVTLKKEHEGGGK
jgi:hypothetical protein